MNTLKSFCASARPYFLATVTGAFAQGIRLNPQTVVSWASVETGKAMTPSNCNQGLEELRGLLVKAPKACDGFHKMVDARDVGIARFQPLFSRESVGTLDAEQFKSFLLSEDRARTSPHREPRPEE